MTDWEIQLRNSIRDLTFYNDEGQGILDFFNSDEIDELRGFFNEKKFRLKDSVNTYKAVNYWESVGLFQSERDVKNGITALKKDLRQFSIVELTWLTCIGYMCDFGLPVKAVRKIEEKLNVGISDQVSEYPLIEYYLWLTMTQHLPVFFKIYKDGKAVLITDVEYLTSCEQEGGSNHLIISLNQALSQNFPKYASIEPIFFSAHKHSLRHEEWALIKELRSGEYQSIKVRLKNGGIDLFEGIEKLEVNKKLIDILRSEGYQNIDLRQENGRVVSIQRTKKKKL